MRRRLALLSLVAVSCQDPPATQPLAGRPLLLTQTLPEGRANTPYRAELEASRAVVWSLQDDGESGLVLRGRGRAAVLEGQPQAPGRFDLRIGLSDSRAGSSFVRSWIVRSAPAPLEVLTSTLPPIVVGAAYEARIAVRGGRTPYLFNLEGFSPSGLAFDATDPGRLFGRVGAGWRGDTLEVSVHDAEGRWTRASLGTEVVTPEPLNLRASQLPVGEVGLPYRHTLTVEGGYGALRWSGAPIALPPGLRARLVGRTVFIEGVATQSGSYDVRIAVEDEALGEAALDLNLRVVDPLRVATTTAAVRGCAWLSVTAASTGGLEPFRWQLDGPEGLSMTDAGPGRRAIEGSVRPGPHTLTVSVEDARGVRAERRWAFTADTASDDDRWLVYTRFPTGSSPLPGPHHRFGTYAADLCLPETSAPVLVSSSSTAISFVTARRGSLFAFGDDEPGRLGRQVLVISAIAGAAPREIARFRAGAGLWFLEAQFSPDGRYLAFSEQDDLYSPPIKAARLTLYPVGSATTTAQAILPLSYTGATPPSHLRFSDDGRRLAFVLGRELMMRELTASEPAVQIATLPAGRFDGMRFVPGSRSKLLIVHDRALSVLDLEGPTPRQLRPFIAGSDPTISRFEGLSPSGRWLVRQGMESLLGLPLEETPPVRPVALAPRARRWLFAPGRDALAAIDNDGALHLVQLGPRIERRTLTTLEGGRRASRARWHDDGRHLIVQATDGHLLTYDTQPASPQLIRSHAGPFPDLLSPGGRWALAAVSIAPTLQLWRHPPAASAVAVSTLDPNLRWVGYIRRPRFKANGQTLVAFEERPVSIDHPSVSPVRIDLVGPRAFQPRAIDSWADDEGAENVFGLRCADEGLERPRSCP